MFENLDQVEWLYFAAYKFFGGAESEEGLKKVEDSYEALVKLRFSGCFHSFKSSKFADI